MALAMSTSGLTMADLLVTLATLGGSMVVAGCVAMEIVATAFQKRSWRGSRGPGMLKWHTADRWFAYMTCATEAGCCNEDSAWFMVVLAARVKANSGDGTRLGVR